MPEFTFPTRDDHLEKVLTAISDWWGDTAEADAKAALEKAREYDGSDLEIMGAAMECLIPEGLTAEERRAAGREMAVMFYALGKIARGFGAYRQGKVPSNDTAHDLTVYSMMMRRIRETGRWT